MGNPILPSSDANPLASTSTFTSSSLNSSSNGSKLSFFSTSTSLHSSLPSSLFNLPPFLSWALFRCFPCLLFLVSSLYAIFYLSSLLPNSDSAPSSSSSSSSSSIFDFHHAPVTWVSFLGHDETLVSASEDTHGIVYERVEHAVFHQSYPHADAIRSGCTLGTSWVCFGDSHGAIHLWNVVKKNKTYTIAAEPDW
ncbi:hypothetical protein HMI54_010727 [Coelomomyces lativittatus]|nr:hypothetical protein HMI54_010727 [Coelomomyces lativittatus]